MKSKTRWRALAVSLAFCAGLLGDVRPAAAADGDSETSAATYEESMQVELMAVGFFEPAGTLSPGGRATFELRPFERFGFSAGATFLTTDRESDLGVVDSRRLSADFAGTIRHGSGSLISSAAFGARAGWSWFSSPDFTLEPDGAFYSQLLFRGRGEWTFSGAWYLVFQIEFAITVTPVDVEASGVAVDEIRGLDADLGLGVGYAF